MTPALPSGLVETLGQVAGALAVVRDPWWIVSSAAAALYGVAPLPIRDVDVLISRKDARILFPALGLNILPGAPDDRFASEIFATWRAPPLAVDFMAGFTVRQGAQWNEVWPRTRNAVTVADVRVFVPERSELAALLEAFGRPKDLARASQLQAV